MNSTSSNGSTIILLNLARLSFTYFGYFFNDDNYYDGLLIDMFDDIYVKLKNRPKIRIDYSLSYIVFTC